MAGARKAGFEPGAVEITSDGTIRLLPIGAPGNSRSQCPSAKITPEAFSDATRQG